MSNEDSSKKVDILVERQWHIGIHAKALASQGWLGKVYGGFPEYRYVEAGIPREAIKTNVFGTYWNEVRRRIPQLCLPPWNIEKSLAEWVGGQKNLNQYQVCYSTTYRLLFPLLQNKGHILILERGSTHPENFFLKIQEGFKDAKLPYKSQLPLDMAEEIEAGKLAHFIGAGSDEIARSYIERGHDAARILRIPYGTDETRFTFYDRTARTSDRVVIACVGVIGIRKGLWRLLKIGEWAKDNKLPVELMLIGPLEPEAKKILEQTRADYRYLGVKKGNDLVQALHDADIYCLPSYEEGFGISVIEAMSTGMPAIVSEETGAREAITDELDGSILRHYDATEFERIVLPLVLKKEKRLEMGKQARQKVEKRYTISSYIKRLTNEYRRMFGVVENSNNELKPSYLGR